MSMHVMNDENIQWCITQIKSGHYNLRTLIRSAGYPYSLIEEKEIAIAGVERDGLQLCKVSAALCNDEDVVLPAVENNGMALEYASTRLKGDKKIVLAAVSQNGMALKFATSDMTKDREVVLAAVENCTEALLYAGSTIKKDKGVILYTLGKKKLKKIDEIFSFINTKLWADEEVALAALAVSKTAVRYINGKLLTSNKNVALLAIKKGCTIWHELNKKLLLDKELLLAAIKHTYDDVNKHDDLINNELINDIDVIKALAKHAMKWLSRTDDTIRGNKDLILYFIGISSKIDLKKIYDCMNPKFKDDKDVMGAFIKRDDDVYKYEISPTFSQDTGFLLEVCSQIPYPVASLYFIDKHISNKQFIIGLLHIYGKELIGNPTIIRNYYGDRDFIAEAVKLDYKFLARVPFELMDDGEFVYKLALVNINSVYYASDRLLKHKQFMLKIVSLNGLALMFANKKLRNDEEVVAAALYQNIAAYQYASWRVQRKFKHCFYSDEFGKVIFKYVAEPKKPSRIASFFGKRHAKEIYEEQNRYHNDTLDTLEVDIEMIPDPVLRAELLRQLGVAKSYFNSNEARLCNDEFDETPDKKFEALIDFIKKQIDNFYHPYKNNEDNSKWF